MYLFLCSVGVHKKNLSCLPDRFSGTDILGVLKVNGIDGKSERQLEKVKAYSGEESKKEGNVYCGLETYTYQSERRESPQSHLLSTQLSLHSQADPSARSHTMLPQPTLMERGKRKRCGESA